MSRSALRVLTSVPLAAAAAISIAGVAHAQTVVGTVQGTVKDDAGKGIPGAIVRLIPSSGPARLAKTNSSGQYAFTGIDPGTYTVQAEVVTFEKQAQTVTVTQDVTTTIDFSLVKTTVRSKSTVVVAPVRRGQVSQQSNVSARTEQLVKSQPNALYQFPGLVFGQPGVTFDSGGYVHIRGGDYNSVGFSVDGVPITEPVYNGFATNIVTVGLKSASVLTGGADASFGGSTGGFINQVTENGRDLKAAGELGSLEYTAGPGNGWNYNGTQIRVGSAAGKFDYYASTIMFSNKFPGNTQISKLNPSFDGILKFNYYVDPNNTATLFLSEGRERYYNYQLPNPAGQPYVHFDPKSGKLSTTDKFVNDIADQRYDFNYANFRHSFTSSSYANLRVYNLFSRSDDHEENTVPRYLYPASNQTGTFLDYQNQISRVYQLKAGIQNIAGKVNWRQASAIPGPSQINPDTGLSTVSPRGLTDRAIKDKPNTLTEYISNQFKLAQDKVTVEAGLRHSEQSVKLVSPNLVGPNGTPLTVPTTNPDGFVYDQRAYHYGKHYNTSFTDPRIGVTYSPSNSWVFRTDYGIQSEFASLRQLETLPSALVGYAPTASNVLAQENRFLRNNYLLNRLKPIHSNNFDIGVEKGFSLTGIANGSYAFAVNGFRRVQRDLVQANTPDYSQTFTGPITYPLFFNNDGHGHASGADFTFTKRLVKKSDWNGFLTYTDLVSRATNEYFNGYYPYWVLNLAGYPGLTDADYRKLVNTREVATGWDQTHTVALVANKRVNRLLETTIFMDAGSGFPFAGGVGSGDAQHGTDASGVFTYVPIVVNQGQEGLQPVNAVAGRTGWHYKFTLNTNFHIDPQDRTYLFLNIDNIFNKKTSVVRATTTLSGELFYNQPTPGNPQGSIYYGNNTPITPRYVSFGVRTKF